ncbi:hypothetical protein GCM10010446_61440 [Streptomyces enissocaesilis]|uniref:Uncharacterized protein n=1 Tax=Streptomyces enissocaesilis TaxID=332589 RepID=A0ABN3XP61_9ACTN
MPFDDAGVPGQGEAGDDRVAVSVDAGGESAEAGQAVLADGVEPLWEPFALAPGELVAALWSRRQLRDDGRYEVILQVWKNGPGDCPLR